MNKIDFTAIKRQLNPETLVPQWIPGGERKVNEWVSRNPRRPGDKTAGSFSVNLETGIWKDFAGGSSDWGSDLISLYAYLFHDDNQMAAARELAETHGIRLDADTRASAAKELAEKVTNIENVKPQPVIPVPDDAPAATFKHKQWGMPSAVWTYRDKNKKVILHVARFDPPGERKQVIPRSWVYDPVQKKNYWSWRGITGKTMRPLYGLDRLQAGHELDVVLVEGEGKADAGQELFGGTAVVCGWLGGVETSDRVSVKALAGRRVILWPDFDTQSYKEGHPRAGQMMDLHEQPGIRAMMNFAQALKGVAREVVMVGYKPAAQDGWDLKDAARDGWDLTRVMEYMGQWAGDPWHVASGKQKPAEKPALVSPPPDDDDGDDSDAPRVPLSAAINPFGYPHMSEKGQPLNTVENLDYLLGEYRITAKYNQVRKQVEVVLPGRSYTADNRANCGLAELTSMCARNRMPQSMLQDYVKLLADRNAYNPVCEWISSKPWDGQKRIKQLLDTVQVQGDPWLKNQLIFRWLLSAVASIFMPHGFEGHGCLVFTGAQGVGKTTWFRRLAPTDMGVVLVGAMLDPNNKDTVTNAVAHWIVELGELDATFRKADIARLKSFIPLATDKLRRPYDRIESEYQRRTVFCASVNEDRYLVDDTGNRRWWTIPVLFIDYQHSIDMQQLWAEVLVQFMAGEQHYLTPEENAKLGELNAEHEAVDPIEEMIISSFDWANPQLIGGSREMTATEVLIAIGFDKPTKANTTKASAVLKELTGGEPHKRNRGRYFKIPKHLKPGRRTPETEDDDDTRPF